MTLEEAIDLLTTASLGWPQGDNTEKYYTALELSIEALKRIKDQRNRSRMYRRYLLPAETPGKSTN